MTPSRRTALTLLLGTAACQPAATLRTHVDPTLLPLHRAAAATSDGLIGRCVTVTGNQLQLDYCAGAFQHAFESFELTPDVDLPAPDRRFDLYELDLGASAGAEGALGSFRIAREQVTTRVRSIERLAIADEHLDDLRTACLERRDAQVVTGVHFGCMRSVDAASLEVSALDLLTAEARTESVAVRGAPAGFRSQGGDAPRCEAIAPIAVEVTDLDVFCARHVLQAHVGEVRSKLEGCRSASTAKGEKKYGDVVTLAKGIHDLSRDLREKDLALAEQQKRRAAIEQQQRELDGELKEALADNEDLREAFQAMVTSTVDLSLQLMGKTTELVQCLTRCED